MRTGRPRPEPQPLPLARAALALAGSLAVHGAVLAAVLLAPTAGPPEPLPAVFVEFVSERAGAAARETAETGTFSAPAPEPAPGAIAPEPVAAPPAVGQDEAAPPAVEPVAAKAVRPRREPPPRPAPAARQPPRLAALPPAPSAPEPRSVAPAAASGEAGRTGGLGANGSGGALATGLGNGEGEPPGFAIGSADNPLPRYPSAARRQGIEGTVILEVLVDAAGLPGRVAIARSSGSGLLDEAAVEAVERWRFRPARRGGEPVEGHVLVPITFRLVAAERTALP